MEEKTVIGNGRAADSGVESVKERKPQGHESKSTAPSHFSKKEINDAGPSSTASPNPQTSSRPGSCSRTTPCAQPPTKNKSAVPTVIKKVPLDHQPPVPSKYEMVKAPQINRPSRIDAEPSPSRSKSTNQGKSPIDSMKALVDSVVANPSSAAPANHLQPLAPKRNHPTVGPKKPSQSAKTGQSTTSAEQYKSTNFDCSLQVKQEVDPVESKDIKENPEYDLVRYSHASQWRRFFHNMETMKIKIANDLHGVKKESEEKDEHTKSTEMPSSHSNDLYQRFFPKQDNAAAAAKFDAFKEKLENNCHQYCYDNQVELQVTYSRYTFREKRKDSPTPPTKVDRDFCNIIDCKNYYDIPLNAEEQQLQDELRKIIPTGEFKFQYPPQMIYNTVTMENEADFRRRHAPNIEPKLFPYKVHPTMRMYDFESDMSSSRRQMREELSKPPPKSAKPGTVVKKDIEKSKVVFTPEQLIVYEQLPDFDLFKFYMIDNSGEGNSEEVEEPAPQSANKPSSSFVSKKLSIPNQSEVPVVETSEAPVDERMESPVMPEQSSTVPSFPCPVIIEEDSTMMDISESSGMPENAFHNLMASPAVSIAPSVNLEKSPVGSQSDVQVEQRVESYSTESSDSAMVQRSDSPMDHTSQSPMVAGTSPILSDDPSAEPIIQYDFDEPSPHFGSVDPSPQLSEAEPLQLPSPAPEKKALRHPSRGRCLRLKTRREIIHEISVHNERRLELNEKRKLLGIQDGNTNLDDETSIKAYYLMALERAATLKINEGKDQNRSESSIDSISDAEPKSSVSKPPVRNVTHKRHLKAINDVVEAIHVDRMKKKRTGMETFHEGTSASAQQVNIVRTIPPVVQTLQFEKMDHLEKQAEPEDLVEEMNEVPETSVKAEVKTLVTPEPEAEETIASSPTEAEERSLLYEPPIHDELPCHATNTIERSPTPAILREQLDDFDTAYEPNIELGNNTLPDRQIEDSLLEEPMQSDNADDLSQYGLWDAGAMPTAEEERRLLDGPDEPVPELSKGLDVTGKVARDVKKKQKPTLGFLPKNVAEKDPEPAPEPAVQEQKKEPQKVEIAEEMSTGRKTENKVVQETAQVKQSVKPVAKRRASRKAVKKTKPDQPNKESIEVEAEKEKPETRKRGRNEEASLPAPVLGERPGKRIYMSKHNPKPRFRQQSGSNVPSTSTATQVRQTGVLGLTAPSSTMQTPVAIIHMLNPESDDEAETSPKEPTSTNQREIKIEQECERWPTPPPVNETSRTSKKRTRQEMPKMGEQPKTECSPVEDDFEVTAYALNNKRLKTEENEDIYIEKMVFNLSETVVSIEEKTGPAKLIREDGQLTLDQKFLISKRLWDLSNEVFLTDPFVFSKLITLMNAPNANRDRVYNFSVVVVDRTRDIDPGFLAFLSKCEKERDTRFDDPHAYLKELLARSAQRTIDQRVTAFSLHKVCEKIREIQKWIEMSAPVGLIGEAERDNITTAGNILIKQFMDSTFNMGGLTTVLYATVEHLNRRMEMLQDGWIMFLRTGAFFRLILDFQRDDVKKMSDEFRKYCAEYLKDIENNYKEAVRLFSMDEDAVLEEFRKKADLTLEDIEELDADVRATESETHRQKCTACSVSHVDAFFSSYDLLEKHQKLHGEESDCQKCFHDSHLHFPFHRIIAHDSERCMSSR